MPGTQERAGGAEVPGGGKMKTEKIKERKEKDNSEKGMKKHKKRQRETA